MMEKKSKTDQLRAGVLIGLCLAFLMLYLPAVAGASELPAEQHPVLLYTEEDIPVLKDRITREPYLSWWIAVRTRADIGLSANFTGQSEAVKSSFAKPLAFAYVMTGNLSYAEKAKEALEAIDPNGDWGAEEHSWAKPLALYSEAYDMLKGTGYLDDSPDSDLRIRQALTAKAVEIDRLNVSPPFGLPPNNWQIRIFSALGLCALALADNPLAQGWLDKAEQRMSAILENTQIVSSTEGGFAEGPYYHNYSAEIYFPYMLAYQRVMGIDLLTDIEALHRWSLAIRLPDGKRPNFDDSSLSFFPFSAFFGLDYPNAGIYHWDWESSGRPSSDYVDMICNYDDSINPELPTWKPTVFLPEAGNALFRSDWSPEAVYMLLLGEHGKARANGIGHEHPDATSFIIYAYGQMLALDSGYIKWEQHSLVNKAKNHNLILVDGEGPPVVEIFGVTLGAGVDAYLKDYYDTESLDFCADSTVYWGVEFIRNVWFVDDKYFIIADRVHSNSGSHTYTWLLHGNGGGSSGGQFSLTPTGGIWSKGNAELLAYLAAPQGVEISEATDIHSFSYGDTLSHSLIRARKTAVNTRYLSVLYPKRASDPLPAINALTVAGGNGVKIEDGTTVAVAMLQDEPGVLTIPTSKTGIPTIESDASLLFSKTSLTKLKTFATHKGKFYKYNGQQYYYCPEEIDLAININEDSLKLTWEGYVHGSGSYTLDLYTGAKPDTVSYQGSPVAYGYTDSVVSLSLSGGGDLRLLLKPVTSVSEIVQQQAITECRLLQNYPNPFNQGTKIRYQIPISCKVVLNVYNLLGKKIVTLENGFKRAGLHSIIWDGEDEAGRVVGSGVYVLRMQTGAFVCAKKLVLIR